MSDRDTIYSSAHPTVDDFVFDERVADVFDNMISRSVPGYRTTISTIGVLANRFVTPNTQCYDLGCSLGAATLAMRHGITNQDCRIIAVDNSAAMVKRCRAAVERDHAPTPVEVVEGDLTQVQITNASMVVMNFTLQFIAPAQRAAVIQTIADGMASGGALVLSEKLTFENTAVNQLHVDLHHSFKRAKGYSDLEIAQKRQAIENVLLPDTLNTHRERLQQAGFATVELWFQCFNFCSLLAIKS